MIFLGLAARYSGFRIKKKGISHSPDQNDKPPGGRFNPQGSNSGAGETSGSRDNPEHEKLIDGPRIDFQMQEDTTERFISAWAFLQAHFSYWTSKDVFLFMLKELTGVKLTKSKPGEAI
jgi:hypothetical protein